MHGISKFCLLGAASVLIVANAASANHPEAPPTRPADARDQRVCKATLETGSLISKRKQCFTRREWDRIAQSQQTGSRKLVEDLTGRYSCSSSTGC